MKKWPSAGGGGSLLLYIDTPLVLGRVVNRDKRGAFCHGWWDHPRLKGDFAREPQKGKFPSLVPGGVERPIRRPREGGGSEWEPINILLERDRGSNKMNSTSNSCLRLKYPSWSRPRCHWSATDPRNQQTTFRAKTHQRAQSKLARLAACATPVRPMACASQAGG
jgi:hypothetical protein